MRISAATHLLDRFRRLRTNSTGTSAVEFGIIAFPFLAIIFAIFEIAYVYFENEMLSAAVTSASRAMMTGRSQAAQVTTASQFVSTYLCPTSGRILPSNFNCSRLMIDVRPATSFLTGDTSKNFYKNGTNTYCPGSPGQVVVMRVGYPLGAIFPLNLFSRTAGVVNDVPGLSGNYHILMGLAVFQEENYTGAFTPSAGC